RDTNLTGRQKEALNIINQSGVHLLNLINDILDLSKIEASRMELYLTDINLPQFLHDIADIIQMRAQQKQIEFHYEPHPHLPTGIQADARRLRQILINLLDNAVKFTDQGSVTFHITSHPLTTTTIPTSVIRFSISDTGVGINHDKITTIFHPFEQVGDHRRRAEGTGLGLTISRRLVQMMNSTLVVESQPAKGSTFWFEATFPLAAISEQLNNAPTKNIIGYTGILRRALIIDDQKNSLLVLSDMLENVGFETILAESGLEGLEKAQQVQPDLILLDIVMPGMDGLETARAIRQISTLKTTPLIAVSASTFDRDREDSLLAGCDAFLPKPLDETTLLNTLSSQLDLEWVEESEGTAVSTPYLPLSLSMTESNASPPKFDVPPQKEMNILLDLAMRGDMRSIRKRADYLSQLNQSYQPFATVLRQLAKGYEEQKILQLIQGYVQ
ncbi:MAG: response regulator, partial [Ardenticatenaceae bacterium]|nr:response regulator [Ardenticatenaceae bacterium]